IEAEALDYIRRIDELGGMVAAIEHGFPQQEIAHASYDYQRTVEKGESVIVGVNKFTQQEEPPSGLLQIGEEIERRQRERLADMKRSRDQHKVTAALAELKRVASASENTMPSLLEAVRAYATVGEICAVLREVFGVYTEA